MKESKRRRRFANRVRLMQEPPVVTPARRFKYPATLGPWPSATSLSRATVRHVGHGRTVGRPIRRRPDASVRALSAGRRAIAARPVARRHQQKPRSFLARMFRRRGPR